MVLQMGALFWKKNTLFCVYLRTNFHFFPFLKHFLSIPIECRIKRLFVWEHLQYWYRKNWQYFSKKMFRILVNRNSITWNNWNLVLHILGQPIHWEFQFTDRVSSKILVFYGLCSESKITKKWKYWCINYIDCTVYMCTYPKLPWKGVSSPWAGCATNKSCIVFVPPIACEGVFWTLRPFLNPNVWQRWYLPTGLFSLKK